MSSMVYPIIDCFMTAFVCGMIFGIVYEFLRIIRRALNLFIITLVCDICFFLLSGIFVFNLSMYLGNYVRIYTILGFGAGVFAYIQTIGRIFSAMESMLGAMWGATIGRIIIKLRRCVNNSISSFAHIIALQFRRINDFISKRAEKADYLLKSTRQNRYNKKGKIISGERSENRHVIQAKVRRGA